MRLSARATGVAGPPQIPASAQPARHSGVATARAFTPNRILALDGLRGLAALSVVLFHYTYLFDDAYGHSGPLVLSFELGQRGVDLFFIISGFVILMTLSGPQTAGGFLVSRFSRIFPAYWVAIVITFAVASLASLPGREVSATEALVNLTMLQDYLSVPRVDNVYWTLTVEFTFYGMMLAAFAIGLIKRPLLISFVWLSMFPLAIILFVLTLEVPARLLLFLTIMPYAHLFIAGMMFYELHRGRPVLPHLVMLAYCLIAYAMWNGLGADLLVVVGAFAAFWFIIHGRLAALGWRPLVLLGTISYPLYLVHQNVGYVALRFLEGDLGLEPHVSIVLTFALVLALAAAITFGVERPAQVAIRVRYRRWREARSGRTPAARVAGVARPRLVPAGPRLHSSRSLR